MENLFEIMNVSEGKEIRLLVGIRVKIAGHETICPVSKICKSTEELSEVLEQLTSDLERLSSKARSIFRGEPDTHDQILSPDMSSNMSSNMPSNMSPDKIWQVLSETVDEDRFIDLFNQLEKEKRKEVAEYVLTQCNVFTGRGAGFSARYNSETALLEDK